MNRYSMTKQRFLACTLALLSCSTGSTAEKLTQPEVVARLSWGNGAGQAGGAGSLGEGAPTSFLEDESGQVHLLDALNYRILPGLQTDGSHGDPIQFPEPVKQSGAFLVDFALVSSDRFVVLDQSSGRLLLQEPDGAGFRPFGRLVHGTEVGRGSPGTVTATDMAIEAVNHFDLQGRFLKAARQPGSSACCDSGGRSLGVVLPDERRAVLTAHDAGPGGLQVLGILRPSSRDAALVEAQVIGVDRAGRIHLVLTEAAGGSPLRSRLLRLSPDGKVEDEIRVQPTREKFSTLPRFYRATPSGDVLGFRTTLSGYELLRYRHGK